MALSSDLRIAEVRIGFQAHAYRSPMKFGGRVVEQATLLDAEVRVRTRAGREAVGFGSMPLGNTWSFPSAAETPERTLAAMRELAGRLARALPDASGGELLDPLEHGRLIEELAEREALAVAGELSLAEPVPKLCTLVTASPFDAAVHDAFGKALGRSVWACYGPEHLGRDLGAWLGPDFAGRFPAEFVSREPRARLPLYHLVGALDALTGAEVAAPAGDGLPESLEEWIRRDGLSHLKVKLDGRDLGWDTERVRAVDRVASAAAPGRAWRYSLDFNERCRDAAYLVEFLAKLGERAPGALARVQYVEQPMPRGLRDAPEQRVDAAARLVPVVIDESLTGRESLELAAKLGYSGAALKACKGQTGSLLMAAAAAARGMFLCVQDLTCPGASFLHSASLAAHVPGASGVEGNARQYCPQANDGWREHFPTVFTVENGSIETGALRGPGLIPAEPAGLRSS